MLCSVPIPPIQGQESPRQCRSHLGVSLLGSPDPGLALKLPRVVASLHSAKASDRQNMGRWVLVSARSHKVLRTYAVLTRLWCPFPDRSAFLRSHAHGHPHMDLLSQGSEFTPLQPVSVGSPQRPSSREGKAGCGSARTAVFGESSLSALSLLFPHTASPVAPGGQ